MRPQAEYYRPLPQVGPARPEGALTLAGGWTWFSQVEVLSRTAAPRVCAAADLPGAALDALTAARPPVAGLALDAPRLMGILNVTPDSFSDGGRHFAKADAVAGAQAMRGADIIDIGGESTRPGAATVPEDDEIARTVPVIGELRKAGLVQPISIDTRKARVAQAALDAGADLVNDVSGFTYDPGLAPLCAARGVPVCTMHAQGDPETMQDDPRYDDVLLDVFDVLAAQIDRLAGLGIARSAIVADPGIGFGKTLDHNLALLSRISLFHSLGVPILLGASRKRFIGTLGGGGDGAGRAPGSVAVALAAVAQGIQILRVHDVADTRQALTLWQACVSGA